nr:molecular chaperone [uncultured Erwinia sp.]
MFIGFDYGTANCSVAIMDNGQPRMLPLEQGSPYLPSMLCAPTREAVSEWLFRHHQVPTPQAESQALLRRAVAFNREEDIEVTPASVKFGLASLAQYMDDPEEVWFVKSPKSFLGASGLKPQQVALFEDLVCAMMLQIRQSAESSLNDSVTQAVIGRPVNFQGLGGEDANQQAEGILARAASRAGFSDVIFQFEPVAAGLDFEATLSKESRVLVVDIGGGTTDCSMLLMGPQWHDKSDRSDSLLGLGGETVKGMGLPALPWWNAVAINDVPAQSDFYAAASNKLLQDLIRDAREPEKVKRLLKVWRQRLSYRLVRAAEESKIALSDRPQTLAGLDFIDEGLATDISAAALQAAISQPLERIQEQVALALETSGTKPDVIYLTGGSAKSPVLRQALQRQLPDIPLTSGDDFGSVTAGLARWAQVMFR